MSHYSNSSFNAWSAITRASISSFVRLIISSSRLARRPLRFAKESLRINWRNKSLCNTSLPLRGSGKTLLNSFSSNKLKLKSIAIFFSFLKGEPKLPQFNYLDPAARGRINQSSSDFGSNFGFSTSNTA